MADSDTPALTDRRVIACNYTEGTNVAAQGARAYVVPLYLGGNLPERVMVRVRSRGGRWVTKWEAVHRLDNFRLATLPPEHPRYSDEDLHADLAVGETDIERLRWAKAEITKEERTYG